MNISLIILLQLVLAHILTDFVFQPNAWVAHKKKHKTKSPYLYLHAFIAGGLTYFFLQRWHLWSVPVFIALSHFFIDAWKLSSGKDNLRYFLWDQVFHLLAIVLAWLYMIDGFNEVGEVVWKWLNSPEILALIAAYLLVIFPVGMVIGKATERWQEDIPTAVANSGSLKSAGRFIGIFERILVLTFIFLGSFPAIGFLIAAKSILRYNEKTESGARKQTEYVLIGTLMSFALAILIGVLVRSLFF